LAYPKMPKGHYVHRDYASVTNMPGKTTPEAWTKGVWWDLRREMKLGEYEGKSNQLYSHKSFTSYGHSSRPSRPAQNEGLQCWPGAVP
jgi:hypothetical protein